MKKVKYIITLVFTIMLSALLLACQKKDNSVNYDERYLSVYNEKYELIKSGKELSKGAKIIISYNFDTLRKEKKIFDNIKINNKKHLLNQGQKEIKITLNGKTSIQKDALRELKTFNLKYDNANFHIPEYHANGVYSELDKVILLYKKTKKLTDKAILLKLNDEEKTIAQRSEFYLFKDTTIECIEKEGTKIEKREDKKIDSYEFSVNVKEYNGKKVLKREVVESLLLDDVITFTKNKNKFVFNRPGKFQIQFRIVYEDNKEEQVIFSFDMKPGENSRVIFNTKDRIERAKEHFYPLENKSQEEIKNELLIKTIGIDNEYIPNLSHIFRSKKLSQTGNEFIVEEHQKSLYEEELEQPVEYVLKNFDGSEVLNQDELFKKGSKNSAIQFLEKATQGDKVYRLYIKTSNMDNPEFELVKISKGVNAYTDLELRKYFFDVVGISSIFLQRNIIPIEHEEQKISTTINGKVVYSALNNNLDNVIFDENFEVDENTMFNHASIYARKFFEKKQDIQQPVKFNGNYYSIDASNFTQVKELSKGDTYNVPTVANGIFCIEGAYTVKRNEIKNIFIKGNGGIHGTLIGENEIPLYAGALKGIHVLSSPLDVISTTILDCGDGIMARELELTCDGVKINNSYSANIMYSGTLGDKLVGTTNRRDVPKTPDILTIRNSKILNAGSSGISVSDRNRKERPKERPNKEDYDFTNYQDVEIYSYDPTCIIENTHIECLVDPNGQIFKTYGVSKYQEQIEKADREYFQQYFAASILNEREKKKYYNIAIFLINTSVDGSPENDPEKDAYYYSHDVPRWDVIIDGKRTYNEANYYEKSKYIKDLTADLPAIILPVCYANNLKDADFLGSVNTSIEAAIKTLNPSSPDYSKTLKTIVTSSYGALLAQKLIDQKTNYRDRYLQLYYTNSFSPTIERVNASVIVGYTKS